MTNQRATAKRIMDELVSLAARAREAEMPMLAYLLKVAIEEARDCAGERGGNEMSSDGLR
ncbi:hypothetical protein [Mangrovibrevibacter kandeliae]|uniref:hypothetical protein n=1 Tax=Mangrovibrevibacter kandeliae TaxID=2968473 RepID=UPI002117783E|nr:MULTISPECIES: hypothetical protein [unclassified Aurantimonas]MCQ8780818.1 hypothetical protein [Aurantimonas sp. CSK15Z-1]MCW4113598.1 hypothetical protein [Aurantimonas sp. MSK8Z-1]